MASHGKKRVLILCTGNSCRSQMAEGWVRHDLGERWEVRSAGTMPAPGVHPLAIDVMAEAGVDISAGTPEPVDRYAGEHWDLVITVCDDAARDCPTFLGAGETVHIGVPDPSFLPGSRERRLEAFRKVRDELRDRLVPEIAARG